MKFIDRDGQFHPTVELDHFSVLQDLLASIGQLLPGSHAFYLVDIIQQRFQPAEFANQCSSGFATQANAWNVIDRVAGQGEHIADKGRCNVPFCSDLIFAQQRECVLGRGEICFRCGIDFDARPDELIEVLVVGCQHDFHFDPLARGDGITAHQVISLGVRKGNIPKTEQWCEFLDELQLRDHWLGHLFAGLLVRRLQLHPFLRHAFVPNHRA